MKRLSIALCLAGSTIAIVDVALGRPNDTKPALRPTPSRADAIRALDMAALSASAKLRSAGLKQLKAQAKNVRASEKRLNDALDTWSKARAVKSCTTAAQRAAALAQVASFAGVYFRRLAGPLHTDVPDLAAAKDCAGDITGERMVGDYLDAIARDDLTTATELVGKIEQQLQCMSARQVRAMSLALRWALEYTRVAHPLKRNACKAAALDTLDQAGLVIMYRAFERSLPYGMIALDWMRTRRSVFLEGLRDSKSVISRMRLFVGERASSSTVVQLSPACRNDARGRLMKFVGADQNETCDPLPALVRSFSDTRFGMGDCLGLDLEPMPSRTGGAVAELACRNSCATLDALSKHKGAAPSPFTGDIGARVRTDGITPLGGRVADVRSTCGSLSASGGGGLGGASGNAIIGCIIDAQSAAAGGNFASCVSRGLASARPVGAVGGASFRNCITRGGDSDDSDPPADRPQRPPPGSHEEMVIILKKEAAREAAIRAQEAARHAPADAVSAREGPTAPNVIQQVGEGVRNVPVVGRPLSNLLLTDPLDPLTVRRTPDIAETAERARYDPPPGPDERRFYFSVGGTFLCSMEGSCASGCTGWDVFTQAFQTCAEQRASRFHRPGNGGVRVRPSPDSQPDVTNPLLACVMPSSSPSLAQQLRGCLALQCPASQMPSVSSSDGTCRCNAGTGHVSGGSGTGGRSPCATTLCPQNTIPVASGARCVCQSIGGPLGPTPRPTSPLPTLPGAGSAAPGPAPIPRLPTHR